MSDTIHRRVAHVIGELFGVPTSALTDDIELADGLQLDSLSLIELTVALEDSFGIRFADEGQAQVVTFGDLVALVSDAVGDEAQSA